MMSTPTPDNDPAANPDTEAAGISAAEAAPMSVELDPSDLAGFTANSPSIRHMLDKIDALEAAIKDQHDADHGQPIQWCQHQMCRTLEQWR